MRCVTLCFLLIALPFPVLHLVYIHVYRVGLLTTLGSSEVVCVCHALVQFRHCLDMGDHDHAACP